MKKSCNIRDVARAAELSPGTVSRILNNRPGNMKIPETTRRRVVELARQMNYVPNVHAQRFFTKRSGVIGLVIPSAARTGRTVFNDPHFAEMMSAMESRLDETRRHLEIVVANREFIENRSYLSLFEAGHLDGVLIWGAYEDELYWKELVEARHPYLFIGSHPRLECWVNMVCCDYGYASKTMALELLQTGYRRILLLDNDAGRTSADYFRIGFESAEAEGNVPEAQLRYRRVNGPGEIPGLFTELRQAGFNPDCVMTTNEKFLQLLPEELRLSGEKIPGGIAVCCCNSTPAALACPVMPTRFIAADFAVGDAALRALENIIDTDDPFLVQERFRGRIQPGVAPPRHQPPPALIEIPR